MTKLEEFEKRLAADAGGLVSVYYVVKLAQEIFGEEKFPKQFPISACCNASVETKYICKACGSICNLAQWNSDFAGCKQDKDANPIPKNKEVCACKEPLLVRSSHPQFYEATCGRCLLSLPPKKPKIEPLEIDMFSYVVTTASIICIVYKINEIIAVINEETQND